MARGRTCSQTVVSSGSNESEDRLLCLSGLISNPNLAADRTRDRIRACGLRVMGPMSLNRVLSVMIPAFNEERTLELILKHVLEQPEVGEVIAVDDGSTDGTWAILSRAADRDRRVRAFRLEKNQGKGAALRRAVQEVRMPFALVQDADLEYDPRDYPTLLQPLVEGRADVVYGVRAFAGQTAFSFWFVMGNAAVTLAANVLFDCFISDIESG